MNQSDSILSLKESVVSSHVFQVLPVAYMVPEYDKKKSALAHFMIKLLRNSAPFDHISLLFID